jgi:hypothetical protein
VGFVVEKVALGEVFPPSTSVFPCQFISTGAPLHGKTKKTDHLSLLLLLHHKGCTISFKAAVRLWLLLRGTSPPKKSTGVERICNMSQIDERSGAWCLGDMSLMKLRKHYKCVSLWRKNKILSYGCWQTERDLIKIFH